MLLFITVFKFSTVVRAPLQIILQSTVVGEQLLMEVTHVTPLCWSLLTAKYCVPLAMLVSYLHREEETIFCSGLYLHHLMMYHRALQPLHPHSYKIPIKKIYIFTVPLTPKMLFA